MTDIQILADYSSLKEANREILAVGSNAQKSARVYEQAFRKVEQAQRKSLANVRQQISFSERMRRQREREAATAQKAAQRQSQENERLRMTYVPLYAASKKYEMALEEINEATARGILTDQQAATAKENLAKQLGMLNTVGVGNVRGFNQLGVAMQQTGYQVGDFLVQVQSGTNAFVAFGQQATQLVGILPLFSSTLGVSSTALIAISAALGIIIPLVTALGAAFMRTRRDADDAAKALSELEEQLKSAEDATKSYADEIERLNRNLRDSSELALVRGIEDAARQVQEAEEALAQAQTRRGQGSRALVESAQRELQAARELLSTREENLRTYRENRTEAERLQSEFEEIAERQEVLVEGAQGFLGVWTAIAAKVAEVTASIPRSNLAGGRSAGRGGPTQEELMAEDFRVQLAYLATSPTGRAGGGAGRGRGSDNRVRDVARYLAQIAKAEEDLKNMRIEKIKDVASNLTDAFEAVITGTKSVGEAFRDMIYQMLLDLWRQQVAQPMVDGISSFISDLIPQANGGAWNKGVQMFADGGVVGSPTMFRHSGGMGMMGEAGPEAIMPLKRGRNGKLGVQMEGSQGNVVINQSFNFSANGDESVKRIIQQEAPKIANYTQKQILEQRRRGGAFKSTFG